MGDPLRDEIDRIRAKIKTYKNLYENSESNVRAHLINPILDNLGWITSEPDLVKMESRTDSGGKPDYELIGKDGKGVLYIEAKALGIDLLNPAQDKPLYQLSQYLFQQGVNFGILTDGAKWVLVKAFDNKPLVERVIWKVDILKKYPSLGDLLQIRPAQIEHLEETGTRHDAVVESWHNVLQNPMEVVNAILPKIKCNLAEKGYELDQDEIRAHAEPLIDEVIERIKGPPSPPPPLTPPPPEACEDKRYTWVQIGQERHTISRNKEILTQTAEWLIRQGFLRPDNAPIWASKRKYLVAKEPKHPTPDNKGKYDFRGKKQLSNGLWMHTNLSTDNCIRYAKMLLNHFGVSDDLLRYGE